MRLVWGTELLEPIREPARTVSVLRCLQSERGRSPSPRRFSAGLFVQGIFVLAALALVAAPGAAADKTPAKARVSLELVTQEGIPINATQQWGQVFADLGIGGLRIHSATGAVEVGVEKRGSKDAPVYDVVGLIKSDNTLYLPGGKFTVNDTARLKKWLAELSEGGAEAVTQPRQAFGLTRSQLADVDGDLKKPLLQSTADTPADKAVGQLAQALGHKLEIDPDAVKALAGSTIGENLQGVSNGTALAAILRPAGLAFAPERAGGVLRYRVFKPAAGRESWPVGWKADQPDQKIVPEMFTKQINVEIDDTPVTEAVAALQERLNMPVLWDHNALALHGIDPAKVQAKLPAKKLTYSLILQRVLSQAKLKKELRVDEAGKPFLWITTIKPS